MVFFYLILLLTTRSTDIRVHRAGSQLKMSDKSWEPEKNWKFENLLLFIIKESLHYQRRSWKFKILKLKCCFKQSPTPKKHKSLSNQLYFHQHSDFCQAEECPAVDIAGSFNSWQRVSMVRQPDGAWTTTLKLEPGSYQFKFIVDDNVWRHDPGQPTTDDNMGGLNNVIEVKEGTGLGKNFVWIAGRFHW